MNILEEIKKEHEEFKSMLEEIESLKGEKKKKRFMEFHAKLNGHHEAEEHILFEDVKEKSDEDGKKVVREMIEEHNLGSYQMGILERTSVDNETWDAKLSVLKEVLTHHMDEEEEELFEQARKVLSETELESKYEPFEDEMEKYKKEKEKSLKGK